MASAKFDIFCFYFILVEKCTEVHYNEIHLLCVAVIVTPKCFQVMAQLRTLRNTMISFNCASLSTSGPDLISSLKRLSVNCAPLKDPNQHILDYGAIKLDL